MKEKLTYDAFYPHPPERVWHALTDGDALKAWLMPTNLKPLIGFRFRFEESNLKIVGEVLEVEVGRRLSYTWDDGEDGAAGVVTWTLRPKDGGTHLQLEHATLAVGSHVLIEAAPNWHFMLGRSLPALLNRVPVPMVYVEEDTQEDP